MISIRSTRAGDLLFGAMAGFGAGSTLIYLLDPQSGRRRRARLRDKARHSWRETRLALTAAEKDMAHRLRGRGLEAIAKAEEGEVDDERLRERVRAELGRVCSHPSAIEVSCRDGVVSLHGPVLSREATRLVRHVRKVRGVKDVEDLLEVYREPGAVPGLQGGAIRRPRFELFQERWAPGPRLLTGAAGLGLAGYGLRRKGGLGLGFGLAGLGLLLGSATNLPFKRLRIQSPVPHRVP